MDLFIFTKRKTCSSANWQKGGGIKEITGTRSLSHGTEYYKC